MTVSSTTNSISYTGDGVTTAFAYTWAMKETSHLVVYVNGSVVSSGFTTTLNASLVGGSVTFSTAPASGAAIKLVRIAPLTQLNNLRESRKFDEENLENSLDLLMMAIQLVNEKVGLALSFPLYSLLSGALPEPTDDEQILYYDEGTGSLKWASVLSLYTGAGGGDGNVVGPSSSTDGNVAIFDGGTGKLLSDSGISIPDPSAKNFYPARVNSDGDGLEYQNIAMTELTIASGSITPTGPAHFVDTEGDIASDELDTLATGSVPDGHRVILFAANTSRDVVIKHGTGNIYLVGDADKTLDDDEKAIMLIRNGSNWYEAGWNSGEAGITVNLSSEQTLTAAASRTVSHGLGTYPSMWGSFFVCKTAESHYAVNDRVQTFNESDGTYTMAASTYATTSVVGTRMPSFGWVVKDKTTGAFYTGAAGGYLTAARWKQVLWWVA